MDERLVVHSFLGGGRGFLGGLGRGEVNGDGWMGSIYIYVCV